LTNFSTKDREAPAGPGGTPDKERAKRPILQALNGTLSIPKIGKRYVFDAAQSALRRTS